MSPIAGVSTVADSLPGIQFESWLGVAAPANLPNEIVNKLNKEIIAVVNQPDVKQKLIDFGGKPQFSSPTEFKMRVQRDIDSLSKVVDLRGITAN
jgi:tripartite-type tricarboxylate transporter receptor subunit TctC